MSPPILALSDVSRRFGRVLALRSVSFEVGAGEVVCLLGDNGAGKSTLIKILSGVHEPSSGALRVDGEPARFRSPSDARAAGVATVFQDLALVPLLSISRNFVLGHEPTRGVGPFRMLDLPSADRAAQEAMARIGIDVRDPGQPVGSLSGGERQCLAIARAVHFGARVLILDEPTSALGVSQAERVLRSVKEARERGTGIVFITHNVHHARTVGDRFCVLERGVSVASLSRAEASRDVLLDHMAGVHTEPAPG